MIRLFLVETTAPFRRIDLGNFKFNEEASAIKTAMERHKWIEKLQCACWKFEGQNEPGPYRDPRKGQKALAKLEQGNVSI